ncbi:MAG: RluA family pseudouridine synthase [Parachlamydiaceae bacterium]|nr:RluA family pseudouridine synthase [Parachlamydiaceae bacterium]
MEIIDALMLLFSDSSKTTIRSWIKEGRVSVDAAPIKSAKFVVAKGQMISVGQKARLVENQFPIIYSDNAIVVIDKPDGLLSVSTAFEKTETAYAYLKRKYYPRQVYVVHRLDQETSGVMIFAFSELSVERLKKTFEKHDLQRCYTAIVEGRLTDQSGTWESYLYDDSNYVVRVAEDPSEGELAITHYRVKDTNRNYTWLELTLETGKKNQIRVHCQSAGHPVVGDKKYGSSCNPLKRLGLHAHYLAFAHPITGKLMKFTSPVPERFHKLMRLR